MASNTQPHILSRVFLSSRGQMAMPDILFAFMLFLLMLGGLIFFHGKLQSDAQITQERKTLDATSANIAEFMLKNTGSPTNWETLSDKNNMNYFGLAIKDRVLSPEKVVNFVNLSNTNYAFTKIKLDIPAYDFYIRFTGGLDLNAGLAPPPMAYASVVQRLATINGIETKVTFTLYAS